MLAKLFELRLTENEFKALSSKSDAGALNIKPETWNAFLKETGKKYGISYRPVDAQKFSIWVPEALAFYRTAQAREKAMLDNLVGQIEANRIERSVLLTGGFHSRDMCKALAGKGYTVLLVTPRFTPAKGQGTHERYLKIRNSKEYRI